MKSKLFFVVALVIILFISTPAPGQDEQITLSTYYPAPYGEYDELCAEKLLVDLPSAAELQDMARGDCHITNSLIVGAGGTGFSYDEIGGSLTDGTVLIKGDVGIGTTNPIGALHLHDPAWDTDIYIGNPPQSVHGHTQADAAGIFIASDTNYASPGGYGGHLFLINKETGKTWHTGIANDNSFRITETAIATLMCFRPGGNVGIGTTSPANRLDVEGSLAVGATYAGTSTAPANGMIIEGNVGIGTTSPQAKLHVADGSTDIVKAYSSGIVDMPKQSMADVYRSSDYSVNPGWNKIDFNVENFDIQNEFDLTNDRFTATIAGKYLVTVNAFFTAMRDHEGLVAAIYKNGARVAMNKTRCSIGIIPRDLGCAVSRIIDLSAGDYVEGWVENNSTVARTVGGTAPGYTGATFMSITKIN